MAESTSFNWGGALQGMVAAMGGPQQQQSFERQMAKREEEQKQIKERAQRQSKLEAALDTMGVLPKEISKTRSLDELEGILAGVQEKTKLGIQTLQQKQLEQAVAEQKQQMESGAAFVNAIRSGSAAMPFDTAMGQGPIPARAPGIEDVIAAAIQNPTAPGAQQILEQAVRQQGKPQPASPPPGSRITGGTVGPNGLSQTFTTEPNRQNEQPQRIFLKDGTPTQKAMYSDGTVIDLPSDKQQSLTEAQANALQYSERMAFNNNILTQLEKAGFNASGAGAAVQNWTPNLITGEQFQSYDAARRNWISAVLRKESGAAISKSEEKGALQQYFPAFGDSPSVVKQKAELRALAETNMRRAIGGIENKTGANPGQPIRFDSEDAARAANVGTNVFELYDPATATYRKARLK